RRNHRGARLSYHGPVWLGSRPGLRVHGRDDDAHAGGPAPEHQPGNRPRAGGTPDARRAGRSPRIPRGAASQLRPATRERRLGSPARRAREGPRRARPQECLKQQQPSEKPVLTRSRVETFERHSNRKREKPMVRIAATEERVLEVQASPEVVYAFFSKPEE